MRANEKKNVNLREFLLFFFVLNKYNSQKPPKKSEGKREFK